MNGFYDYYHRHNIHCNAKDLVKKKKENSIQEIFNNETLGEVEGSEQSVID